jgi:hypothetical protein
MASCLMPHVWATKRPARAGGRSRSSAIRGMGAHGAVPRTTRALAAGLFRQAATIHSALCTVSGTARSAAIALGLQNFGRQRAGIPGRT